MVRNSVAYVPQIAVHPDFPIFYSEPAVTDEVADASDELLNEDPNNGDLEPSEDFNNYLEYLFGYLNNTTQGPPEDMDRFIKKKWNSWKKSAEKKWKDAKKAAEEKWNEGKKKFSWKNIAKAGCWNKERCEYLKKRRIAPWCCRI